MLFCVMLLTLELVQPCGCYLLYPMIHLHQKILRNGGWVRCPFFLFLSASAKIQIKLLFKWKKIKRRSWCSAEHSQISRDASFVPLSSIDHTVHLHSVRSTALTACSFIFLKQILKKRWLWCYSVFIRLYETEESIRDKMGKLDGNIFRAIKLLAAASCHVGF